MPRAGLPADLIEMLAACLAQRPEERVVAAHTLRDLLACSRANSLRPDAASREPPPLEVIQPGALPVLSSAVLPPGVTAPRPAPLGSPHVQHISIPKPELVPAARRLPVIIGLVLVVLLVTAIVAVLFSGALG